jgi:hypothetical protein
VTDSSDVDVRFGTLEGLFAHILLTKLLTIIDFKETSAAFLKFNFFGFLTKKISKKN